MDWGVGEEAEDPAAESPVDEPGGEAVGEEQHPAGEGEGDLVPAAAQGTQGGDGDWSAVMVLRFVTE